MQYREYGQTGKISALGFGCMRLPERKVDGKWQVDDEKTTAMLRRAAALGVNYFDTGYYYCHKHSEAAVGRALKPIRSQVMISTKLPIMEVKTTGDFRRWLERSLTELDTDYVDYYHFWALNRILFETKVISKNLLKEAQKAKEEGLLRHISFSFHDSPKVIKKIIDRGEIFETMLVQYNMLDRSNEDMIAYAAEKGMGVAAMGPVGGGKLAAPSTAIKRAAGRGHTTYELALKFVLGNPHISCALSGMGDEDMLLKNIAVAQDENPLSPAEWRQIGDSLERLKRFSDLYCTGCAYCQPCPAGIDIPRIFGTYTNYNVYELTEHAKTRWHSYLQEDGKTIAACRNCGFCEKQCPQRLQVRAELARVEEALGKL